MNSKDIVMETLHNIEALIMHRCRMAGFKLLEIESLIRQVAVIANCDKLEIERIINQLSEQKKLFLLNRKWIISEEMVELIKHMLANRYRRGAQFSITEFKNLFSISRKFAIPLLELLVTLGVTKRVKEFHIYQGES
ncbi:MAG: SelB C-terminal domain-containing protein [Candidatus Sumerlaeia bacterium]|nr:SelB C-terminal domain-containing protein [Candidatus Sumerlaeia bacterium]